MVTTRLHSLHPSTSSLVGFFEPKHSPHLELQSKVSPPKKCRFFALGVCDSKLQLGFSLAQGRQKL